MAMHTRMVFLILPFLTFGSPLSAQTIRGWVFDEASRQPVRGVDVAVVDPATDSVVARQSSTTGSFQLFVGVAGQYQVRVNALGYEPLAVELELEPATVLTLELRIRADAVALEPVRVVAERREPWFMEDFRWRQQRGYGRFLTREDIESWGGASLEDVLAIVPGVNIVHHELGNRMVPTVATRAAAMAHSECFASIWVNGVREFETILDREMKLDTVQLLRAEEIFYLSASEIEAVEVYRGVAELPAEFGGSTGQCGAVAIWLRSGFDPTFVPMIRPAVALTIHAAAQHLRGHLAPGAGAGAEVGVYLMRPRGVGWALRLRHTSHAAPREVMEVLTVRLSPDSYALPDGSHPMRVTLAMVEARSTVAELGAIQTYVLARAAAGQRRMTFRHRVQGASAFGSFGWGGGAGLGAQLPVGARGAMEATFSHDLMRFSRFQRLDQPDEKSSRAIWGASTLRLGFSLGLGSGI